VGPSVAGLGGAGGGGAGSNGPAPGTPGTPGRGGGGGASPTCPALQSGTGGSGTVILAIPQANFPTLAPGATVSTAPPSYPGVVLLTYNTSANTTPSTFTYTA
jgi:hypothetical protein